MGLSHRRFYWQGFTLVEVMISVGVFAVVAGAMISTLLIGQYSTQAARNRNIANNLISTQIENVGTWTEATIRGMVNAGGGTASVNETKVPSVVTDPVFASGFQSRITTITPKENYFLVTVEVKWRQKVHGASRIMTETGATYVFPMR